MAHAATEARLHLEDLEQLTVEHPTAYDSSGDGEIEVAVKQLAGVLRTNGLDLKRRVGETVPLAHPVVTWLDGYAAWMVNVRSGAPTASQHTGESEDVFTSSGSSPSASSCSRTCLQKGRNVQQEVLWILAPRRVSSWASAGRRTPTWCTARVP